MTKEELLYVIATDLDSSYLDDQELWIDAAAAGNSDAPYVRIELSMSNGTVVQTFNLTLKEVTT